MSKSVLISAIDSAKSTSYKWSLYFFKIDKRNRQPYKTYKVRFHSDAYLPSYANQLLNTTLAYQINGLSQVQDYDGENTKVTCDKIALDNLLISEQWDNFFSSVALSSDNAIEGKLNGYVLSGSPDIDSYKPIVFLKVSNPITKISSKKSVVFSNSINNELDLITDDICRLYLTVDAIVYDETMYSFNHAFESVFDLEKTMSKVKNATIDEIVSMNAISNVEDFKNYAMHYKSPRTFISFKQDRKERLMDRNKRRSIAQMLHLELDTDGNIVLKNYAEASLLIRYLCYKVFKDSETEDVLEASTITKLDLK